MNRKEELVEKTRIKAELQPEIRKEILDLIQINELIFPKLQTKSRQVLKDRIKEIYTEAFKKASIVLNERIVKDIEDVENTVILKRTKLLTLNTKII